MGGRPQWQPGDAGRIPRHGHAGTDSALPVRQRKPYVAPAVLLEGDVRGVVLGGSPGAGDSGGSTTQNFGGNRPGPPPYQR